MCSTLQIPKIELHLHLDCSLSYDVVKQIDPSVSLDVYRNSFIAPVKCNNLSEYISRAAKAIDLMQTRDQLRMVTLDLFSQLKNDNVIYAEIRFAPLQHIYKGLTAEEVVKTVEDAVNEGISETGVEAGLILCTCRHFTESQSMATVNLVEQFSGTKVVGLDIAADEANFPIDNHIKAFTYAFDKNLNITAHAGEAKGPESIWETLKHFRPSRIGHGIRCVEDPDLMEYLKNENIHLEVCPTSNIQTNVVDKIENHPVDRIFQSGISMSLNTDTRTISDINLADEYNLMNTAFKWEKEHLIKCNLEAIRHSFTTDEKKENLREKIIRNL